MRLLGRLGRPILLPVVARRQGGSGRGFWDTACEGTRTNVAPRGQVLQEELLSSCGVMSAVFIPELLNRSSFSTFTFFSPPKSEFSTSNQAFNFRFQISLCLSISRFSKGEQFQALKLHRVPQSICLLEAGLSCCCLLVLQHPERSQKSRCKWAERVSSGALAVFESWIICIIFWIEADLWYLVNDRASSITLTHFKYKAVMTRGRVVSQLS